jgi:hypothetical protein
VSESRLSARDGHAFSSRVWLTVSGGPRCSLLESGLLMLAHGLHVSSPVTSNPSSPLEICVVLFLFLVF